jgi:hypothetical protein
MRFARASGSCAQVGVSNTEHDPAKACPGPDPGWARDVAVARRRRGLSRRLDAAAAERFASTSGTKGQ